MNGGLTLLANECVLCIIHSPARIAMLSKLSGQAVAACCGASLYNKSPGSTYLCTESSECTLVHVG